MQNEYLQQTLAVSIGFKYWKEHQTKKGKGNQINNKEDSFTWSRKILIRKDQKTIQ